MMREERREREKNTYARLSLRVTSFLTLCNDFVIVEFVPLVQIMLLPCLWKRHLKAGREEEEEEDEEGKKERKKKNDKEVTQW